MINATIDGDNNNQIEVFVQQQKTPTGKLSNKFSGYIRHRSLNKNTTITDTNVLTLQERLNKQANEWITEWEAISKNEIINNAVNQINNLLSSGMEVNVTVDWGKAKNKERFPKSKPALNELKPKLEDTHPKPNILDKLIKSHYEKILSEQKKNFEEAVKLWGNKKNLYEKELKSWNNEKNDFEKRQQEYNDNIDNLKADYKKLKQESIEKYCQLLLEQSNFSINFEKKIAIEYQNEEKRLIVEYFLPSIEDFPKIREFKYLKSTNQIKEIPFSGKELNPTYDKALYEITLLIIYKLFKADEADAINDIVFNGCVNKLNKATGKRQDLCILSLMVNKSEFMDIDLTQVDAKVCFKSLKGVSASALSDLAQIPRILKINKEDKRFIEAREVGENIDNSTNIAAMDWRDFEQLVREIFERVYSPAGGEVKVTQSSRDKGVDAVAFDPDPIKGGKIIIQAKRYTNTVHVESVRALYGIMQDEGAMKGILITTSDFGSDSISFAKDKPITLLNGGNLLSMLQEHGIRGKIDLNEAKKILGESVKE